MEKLIIVIGITLILLVLFIAFFVYIWMAETKREENEKARAKYIDEYMEKHRRKPTTIKKEDYELQDF